MTANMLGSALAIAALGIGLAACGSDSSKSDGPKLAKAELISQANAICDAAQTSAKSVTAPESFADPAAAAEYFDQVAPIGQVQAKALQALTPADDVKADYEAFTDAQQEATDLVVQIQEKAHDKDQSAFKDIEKLPASGQKVVAAASKLGAETCAK